MANEAKRGQWVQVRRTILLPRERTARLPEDTHGVALEALIKGFLTSEASVGDTVTIETVVGRKVEGILVAVEPHYLPTFGAPVPELLPVGQELRRLLGERED